MILRVLLNNFVGFPLQFTLIIALWSASQPMHDRAGQVLVGLMAEHGDGEEETLIRGLG